MSLKVIGGGLRGRSLLSPRGSAVRPTAGRVRGAIFNMLMDRMDEAIVLDLFAGTGAMGIEALSRGAARAVFVDSSQTSLTLLKKNLLACGLEPVAGTLRQDATRSLSGLTRFAMSFDIVFMDPPYEQKAVGPTLAVLDATGVLKAGAMIVAEHSPREKILCDAGRFSPHDRRKYGDTCVSFFEYLAEQPAKQGETE